MGSSWLSLSVNFLRKIGKHPHLNLIFCQRYITSQCALSNLPMVHGKNGLKDKSLHTKTDALYNSHCLQNHSHRPLTTESGSRSRSISRFNLMSRSRTRSRSRSYGIYESLVHSVQSPYISRTFSTSGVCYNPNKSRNCWKCGGNTNPANELFFCECGVVQKPADDLTFFDLLQMQQQFDLDLKTLAQLYRHTQNRLHPDKFYTKSEEEQAFAEEQSALLNKAYFTLLKPLSRAIYMLELVNITIEENDSYSDPEFLMDIMTINEKISSASSSVEIDELDDMNEEKVNESVNLISEAFRRNDIASAKNFTITLRYYTTIQERIKELRIKNMG